MASLHAFSFSCLLIVKQFRQVQDGCLWAMGFMLIVASVLVLEVM